MNEALKLSPRPLALADLPGGLAARLAADPAWSTLNEIYYHGPLKILEKPLTAFLYSRRAASAEILGAYDRAVELRRCPGAVIGGFHSPVERDGLKILLKGPAPIILCPARSLTPTLLRGFPDDFQPLLAEALAARRLLVLTPFAPSVKRASRETAQLRNHFVNLLAGCIEENIDRRFKGPHNQGENQKDAE